MKLRIRGNTLRLRLSRAEIAALAKTGHAEDRTRFTPGSSFHYRIEVAPNATTPTALLDPTGVTVRISPADLQAWLSPDAVGLYSRQPIDAQDTLELALEKDFACLEKRPTGDDDETFPHPAAAH